MAITHIKIVISGDSWNHNDTPLYTNGTSNGSPIINFFDPVYLVESPFIPEYNVDANAYIVRPPQSVWDPFEHEFISTNLPGDLTQIDTLTIVSQWTTYDIFDISVFYSTDGFNYEYLNGGTFNGYLEMSTEWPAISSELNNIAFQATPFSSPTGATFAASEWEISQSVGFDELIYTSGEVPDNGEHVVLFSMLEGMVFDGEHFWRLRYRATSGAVSAWSLPTRFVIINAPSQPS